MTLEEFAKQKSISSPPTDTEPSAIEAFFAGQSAQKATHLNIVRGVNIPKEEHKKKLSKWQWLSKQLMKPVGAVAAESEAIGKAIRDKKLYIPGVQTWKVLSGKREYSFSKLWHDYGPGAGINPKVATAIGFVSDLYLDPLNFIGGGLTKTGKLASKVSSLSKAGKTISKTSKLGRQIAKLGYSVDDLMLAATKAEQAAKGQRAVLKVFGKPVVKGVKFYKALEKTKKALGVTKAGQALRGIFSTKTGIKDLDELVEGLKNLSEYRKQQVIEKARDIQRGLKKLDPEDIKLISEAIERPEVREGLKLAKDIKAQRIAKLADKMDNLFIGMKKREKAVGVLKSELENYFPHIKAKESLGKRIETFFNPKKYSQVLKSAKHRKIAGTIKEINEMLGKEFFETNPAVAYAYRGLASTKAVTAKEFLEEVGKKFFVNAEKAPIAFVESTNPLFKGLKADPRVVKVVDQYIQGIKPDELKLLIRAFDRVQNWWKAQALISPSYHTRNMVSNFWNNWLAGVKNPISYKRARLVQQANTRKGTKLLNKVLLTTDAGEILKTKDVLKLAKQKGVIGRGWYGSDIARQLAEEVGGKMTKLQRAKKILPISQENYLFKANRALGSMIEDNARLAHFIEYLQKGYSADDAARSVKKFLFDYGDLTQAEKTIFKRIFPFYTWTRKNIPVQLENLIVQPAKFAAVPKAIQAIEENTATPKTEKYLSKYITDNIPVRIGTDKKGHTKYFLLGNWLPSAQAINFLSQPIDNIIQMVTPFVKTPIEIWANKSTFFKNTLGEPSKIEYYYRQPTEFVGIPMRRKVATLMRNIRILNDLDKLVKTPAKDEPENSWAVKFLNVLFGKAATYDIKKSRYFYRRDTDERISELKAAIKRAKKLGKKAHAKRLSRKLKKFRKERGR